MYVIQRTDKDYGSFTQTHETLEAAIEEAERLATKHVQENPSFAIFELKKEREISSKVLKTVSYS